MHEDRDLLLIAIFTAMTIVLWIFFELVKTTQTSTISPSLQQTVSPFSPKLDTELFDMLESRQTFD